MSKFRDSYYFNGGKLWSNKTFDRLVKCFEYCDGKNECKCEFDPPLTSEYELGETNAFERTVNKYGKTCEWTENKFGYDGVVLKTKKFD